MRSFQTAQGHAFRKLFYAAGAVIASMRCLFLCLWDSSMSSFQTAQGHAFRKLFYDAGAVTASMR